MNVYVIGVLGFFALFLIIGKIAGSRVKNSDDYYVSGRSAPTFVIAGTLVACYASTVAFLGESGFSYNGYPVLLLILMIFNVLGYTLGGAVFRTFSSAQRLLHPARIFRFAFCQPESPQSHRLDCGVGHGSLFDGGNPGGEYSAGRTVTVGL